MLQKRIIPCLLLSQNSLVKTTHYQSEKYIGDPINTAKIFNELEVDEMCILDIYAAKNRSVPDFSVLQDLASECFMPLSYGGGIDSMEFAEKILKIGYEKVIVNTALFTNPDIVQKIAARFGSQAVVGSIDVKKNWLNKYSVYSHGGQKKEALSLEECVRKVEALGLGEILLNDIGAEGTWEGFDISLIQQAVRSTQLPVIAHGGAGSLEDIKKVFSETEALAVGVGSMVVYQQKDMGVLVNFPDVHKIRDAMRLL